MTSRNNSFRLDKLILLITLPLAIGFVGSLFTTPSINGWYAALNKPFFNPPNWIFAPVWTLLYFLMGLSSFLVFHKHTLGTHTHKFFRLYFLQLVLNLLWSIIFFTLHLPLLALLEIVLLWLLIYYLIRLSYRLLPLSAYLLAPYLAWVTFATLLNFAIVLLN